MTTHQLRRDAVATTNEYDHSELHDNLGPRKQVTG